MSRSAVLLRHAVYGLEACICPILFWKLHWYRACASWRSATINWFVQDLCRSSRPDAYFKMVP